MLNTGHAYTNLFLFCSQVEKGHKYLGLGVTGWCLQFDVQVPILI